MSHQQYQQRFQPPELYSISRGIVSKIESYGCFVKLHNSPVSGLVHISQLYSTKIDNVTDVVSLDMEVWVKVIGIQVETIEDETTGRTRQRHKVKLSMKYVNQDTGQDLDPENENIENDMQRISRGGGGRGGMSAGNVKLDGTNGANSQLGQALSSNIGMSIAMDPGNLVLKGKRGATSIAGYSLVREDEGEPEFPAINNNNADHQESMMPVEQKVVRPMGRGRGTTLPAWMTRVDSEDKLGSMSALPSAKDDDNSSRRSDRHRSKRSHHRKERRSKKHHKKHKSRKHKDHRSSRGGRSRSYSYSSYSSTSRSRSRSRSTERRSSKHKKKKSHKHHKRRRHRSDSRSRSHNSREEHSTSDFTNVDEARAIMQRLESKRRMEAGS